jgi:hypothetical protein
VLLEPRNLWHAEGVHVRRGGPLFQQPPPPPSSPLARNDPLVLVTNDPGSKQDLELESEPEGQPGVEIEGG